MSSYLHIITISITFYNKISSEDDKCKLLANAILRFVKRLRLRNLVSNDGLVISPVKKVSDKTSYVSNSGHTKEQTIVSLGGKNM